MKTFGRAIVAARKNAGLTQKAVAARLRRSDGRAVTPPYLNELEHDHRHPPENTVIEQLAQVLNVSPDLLYFYARHLPANVEGNFDEGPAFETCGSTPAAVGAGRVFRPRGRRGPQTSSAAQ